MEVTVLSLPVIDQLVSEDLQKVLDFHLNQTYRLGNLSVQKIKTKTKILNTKTVKVYCPRNLQFDDWTELAVTNCRIAVNFRLFLWPFQ